MIVESKRFSLKISSSSVFKVLFDVDGVTNAAPLYGTHIYNTEFVRLCLRSCIYEYCHFFPAYLSVYRSLSNSIDRKHSANIMPDPGNKL